MTNEQYLTTSYWVVGIVSLVVGVVTCIIFKRSVAGMTLALPSRRLAVILRRLFAPVIVLTAMTGFLCVSFYGCDVDSYQKVIANRTYLVAKNQEQLSAALSRTVGMLFLWALLFVVVLWICRRGSPRAGTGKPETTDFTDVSRRSHAKPDSTGGEHR